MESVIKDNDGSSNTFDPLPNKRRRIFSFSALRFIAKDVGGPEVSLPWRGNAFHTVLFWVFRKLHLPNATSQHVCLTLTI